MPVQFKEYTAVINEDISLRCTYDNVFIVIGDSVGFSLDLVEAARLRNHLTVWSNNKRIRDQVKNAKTHRKQSSNPSDL